MANFQPYFLATSTFDQLPKKNGQILAVDRKLQIIQNDINKTFDQLPKKNERILAVDQNFFKA
jgi:hypothetical protein